MNNSRIKLFALITVLSAEFTAMLQAEQVANHQIYCIRPDGSEIKQITHDLDYRYGAPTLSPDGKQIAADRAWSHQSLQDTHVVVMDADGSNLRDLCHGSMPAWSPDSRVLALHTYTPTSAIVIINSDDTGYKEVTDHWGSPVWSPAGDKILCLGYGQGFSVVDLATGKESAMPIPDNASAYQGFSLSADGKQLCFGDSAQGGISIASLENWDVTKLEHLLPGTTCKFCSWSPDGSQIVFSMLPNDGGKQPQLHILEMKSKEKPRKLAGQNPEVANVNPKWSPDGKWIVFSSDPAE